MANKLFSYALAVRDRKRTLDVLGSGKFKRERQEADIMRLVHSIEKGLCLENPRLGFGVTKLNNLFALCDTHAELFGRNEFCLKMARDVIKTYIDFHKDRGYQSDEFSSVCDAYASFPCESTEEDEVFGGVVRINNKSELNIEQIEAFFADRHSVRDFADKEVPAEVITRAVRAAQYAPSACNRQAVRAYVLPSSKICEFYKNDLTGIGGFAQSANKFILITGKLSAYDTGESNQHIVSAGIFAAYLIEALFSQNIGSCMVQRPLYFSKQWENIAQKIGVPEDERLVLMIAIGHMKDEYVVPVSKRFPTDYILKFID